MTPPNSLSFGWILPQYILVSAAEILLITTGLTFTYCEAPPEMKTFPSALWYVARGIGQLIALGIKNYKLKSRVTEIFLCAGSMVVATIVFVVLTWWYRHAKIIAKTTVETEKEIKTSS